MPSGLCAEKRASANSCYHENRKRIHEAYLLLTCLMMISGFRKQEEQGAGTNT